MTPSEDVSAGATVLAIDVPGDGAFATGRTIVVPQTKSVLTERDGPIYHAYQARTFAHLPRVVDRRYSHGDRPARVITAHFRDGLQLLRTESLAVPGEVEMLGTEREQCFISFRVAGDTLESAHEIGHRIGPGTCYLIRYGPGVCHGLRPLSEELLTEVCVGFLPAAVAERLGITRDELVRRLCPNDDHPDPAFSEARMTPEMHRLVAEVRASPTEDPAYPILAEAQALRLIALYLREMRRRAGRGRPRESGERTGYLDDVRELIERNYAREVSIEELCAATGAARKSLTSAFRREYGMSIGDYRRNVRVEIAKSFLREGSLTVREVAERVGYAYPANFAKVFRERVGLSPLAYRRRTPEEP